MLVAEQKKLSGRRPLTPRWLLFSRRRSCNIWTGENVFWNSTIKKCMQNKINLQENYSENFRSNQNEALGPLQKWWTRFSKCRFLRQNRRRKARPFLQVRKIEIDILNMNWWWKSQKLNHFLTLRYQTWNLLWIHFSNSLLLNFMQIFDVFSSRNVF